MVFEGLKQARKKEEPAIKAPEKRLSTSADTLQEERFIRAESLKQRIADTWRITRTSSSYVPLGNGKYRWEHMNEHDNLITQYTERLKAVAQIDPDSIRRLYEQSKSELLKLEAKLKTVDDPEEEMLYQYELLYSQRNMLEGIVGEANKENLLKRTSEGEGLIHMECGRVVSEIPSSTLECRVTDLSPNKNHLLHPEEVQLMVQRWHKLGKPKIPVREWKTVTDLEKWLNSPSDPWGWVVEDLLKVRKFLDEADG
jgi:hypothetical protein